MQLLHRHIERIVVLGAGESGAGAARLGQREGADVFVSDAGPGNARSLAELDAAGIAYETGRHTTERIYAADLVVKSPGIPDSVPLIRSLRERGIPVISEIELAWHFRPAGCTVVGITGSNGKTTTTMLTHHLLATAGRRALAGGNLGDSFARLLLDEEPAEVYVLELSSFQLDGMAEFRPEIAAVLNVTPDHLDRYDYDISRYADSKVSIAARQREEDTLLVLADPQNIAPALRRLHPTVPVTELSEAALDGTTVTVDGAPYELADSRLRGRHNALNALFALTIARRLGVEATDLRLALADFRPAAHRMEVIGTPDGRHWINDSKATNVDATYFALEAMTGPTVWIAGGTDKGNDYDVLKPLVRRHVHTLICMGVDNEKLKAAFGDEDVYLLECGSAQAATVFAHHRAAKGDTVLLSPCCASFDLFKNYIDRGDQFRAAVQRLTV